MNKTSTVEINKTTIVETKTGKLQGYISDGIQIFKGVPYAEPPIGELRFQPPLEKKPWSGILNAEEYGPCSFQAFSPLEEYFGKPEPESEDCLTLNIWTPATDSDKRPVMFWIHGGGFCISTGKDPMYEGFALARRGDIVVVTINYRLGSFGFFSGPGIPSNVGSQDQIMALKWIKDNIKSFGGDPNDITIFGESAGAYSVLALCVMPTAKDLFQRVIAQSAPFIDPRVSHKTTKKIMRKLGVKGGKIDDIREIPPEKIIEVQNEVFETDPANVMALRPLIDGDTLPMHPLKGFLNGDCADIDLMIGTNLDEAKLFTALEPLKSMASNPANAEKLLIGYLGMILGFNPDKSNEILNKYNDTKKGKDPKEIMDIIVTDATFRIPTIRFLEAQRSHQPNVYNYLFSWPSPGLDGILGSCHSIEIPFVFGTTDAPNIQEFLDGAPTGLSEKVMDAWIAFARNGNPNNDSIPEWPAYNAEKRATMVLGDDCKVEYAIFDEDREVWDGELEI